LPSRYLKKKGLDSAKLIYTPHHASHAAAGYYTSGFDQSAVVVLDAIGEFECASIWQARGKQLKKLWSKSYPHSLGLFYSAFTKLIGLIPIQQEHQLQKLSEQGNPERFYQEVGSYFSGTVELTANLHRGVWNWSQPILADQDRADIAAAVQKIFEEQVSSVMDVAIELTGSRNLVYMGGCAMNSLANRRVVEDRFEKIWSLPQPGDPSSSLGAILYHQREQIPWWTDLATHINIKV
jgi:carbamoyltransferase